MARSASSFELISTNPKPRDLPVIRSVRTVADSHVPALENASRNSSPEVSKDRLPTNSFLPIYLSSLFLSIRTSVRTHETPHRNDDPSRGQRLGAVNRRLR